MSIRHPLHALTDAHSRLIILTLCERERERERERELRLPGAKEQRRLISLQHGSLVWPQMYCVQVCLVSVKCTVSSSSSLLVSPFVLFPDHLSSRQSS